MVVVSLVAQGAAQVSDTGLRDTLIGAVVGATVSLLVTAWLQPRVRRRERARERWEADVVALADLLTVQIPRVVEEVKRAWWGWAAVQEFLQDHPDVDTEKAVALVEERRVAIKAAVSEFQNLAGPRLEWLARRFESRRTRTVDRAVYPLIARVYRSPFNYVSAYWADDVSANEQRNRADREFEEEKKMRRDLLQPVLAVAERELWPRARRLTWQRVRGFVRRMAGWWRRRGSSTTNDAVEDAPAPPTATTLDSAERDSA